MLAALDESERERVGRDREHDGADHRSDRERPQERRKKAGKLPLYVRGAISDAKTASEGAVNVFSRSSKKADRVVTGVAGVPDDFGYWEKELLKLGHAAIHDKVLVIDPFSDACAVVTGSGEKMHLLSAVDAVLAICNGAQS